MTEYTVIRSARKTIGLTVRNAQLYVHAPNRATKSAIDGFIAEKSKWIQNKIELQKRSANEFSDIFNLKAFLILGKRYSPRLSCKYKKAAVEDDCLMIPQKYETDIPQLRKHLIGFYKKLALTLFSRRIAEISQETGLCYSSLALTNARGKWGSCDGRNNIRLNWRLLLLPPEIIEYVMIHELCHTQYHNHSADFWLLVEKNCLHSKTKRKILRGYSPLVEYLR